MFANNKRETMYYNNDRLGFSEYRGEFYDLLSSFFDDENYVQNNISFFESVINDTFERYENNLTENYSIRQIVTLFAIFLKNNLHIK